MFLKCSYFFAKSEADVLINSVLIKRKACISGSKHFFLLFGKCSMLIYRKFAFC